MSLKTRGILVVIIGTVMGFSLSLGGGLLNKLYKLNPTELSRGHDGLFNEVMQSVKREYVEQIDDSVLLDSAIRGMVSDLDSHSQYLNAEQFKDIRISTTGSYSGVGLVVSIEDGVITVVPPIDDTPAERAGILYGDRIIAIDDNPIDSDHLYETIAKIRGRTGTHVKITVTDSTAHMSCTSLFIT